VGERGVNPWRAGCAETCTSGSEGGPGSRTGCKAGTAPRFDPYTKLLGPAKWTYYYLYVVLDVFSRYVVGWTIQYRESAHVAQQLIAQAIEQQDIPPGQLTVHADRGSSMRSKPVAFLLADLDVTKTHSRPYTSTDNPFSEAQFKTLKYRPDFPDRFDSIEHSRAFGSPFFNWYNHEHCHSGIAYLTPATVHYGLAEQVIQHRARVLAAAHAAHPERFVHGAPKPPALPPLSGSTRPNHRRMLTNY
jgi:putative transposase